MGIIDQAVNFVLRARSKEKIEGTRRVTEYVYPPEVLREVVVNAVAHRDYTIGGTNIGIWLYPDRLEIDSPGNLPNTITIERMKSGVRYHRNQTIVDYLRDMEYIEGSGRGVSRKIIRGMIEHNGKEPALGKGGTSLNNQITKDCNKVILLFKDVPYLRIPYLRSMLVKREKVK